jgi:4-diphosphocytidyl-2-C-methyl-D-erythritol kinase
MPVTVRSFAKINLGLCIGWPRADGFHELRTVYQTIGLHDTIRVGVVRGSGIEVRCADERVPKDERNTCYRIVERAMSALKAKGKVIIEIEKRLPVEGGLGGASSNAVATLLALERALKKHLSGPEKLRIAAEVGSDLPLFLIGGTVLGVGRGEEVYPLPDLPTTYCVLAAPAVGVSTPKAFADWDRLCGAGAPAREGQQMSSKGAVDGRIAELRSAAQTGTSGPTQAGAGESPAPTPGKLTLSGYSDKMNMFGRTVSSWLSGVSQAAGKPLSGVPARGRGRAETPLLDLVRTGIENDFERVVFPKYPELREVKRVLERAGALYASLSGSGSAVYGLFRTRPLAQKAAAGLRKKGIPAQAATTLTREQYWNRIFDC